MKFKIGDKVICNDNTHRNEVGKIVKIDERYKTYTVSFKKTNSENYWSYNNYSYCWEFFEPFILKVKKLPTFKQADKDAIKEEYERETTANVLKEACAFLDETFGGVKKNGK